MNDGALIVIDWGTVLSIEDLGTAEFRNARCYPLAGTDTMLSPEVGFSDSGHATNRVYDMCATPPPPSARAKFRWWPMKGASTRTGTYTTSKIRSHPMLELYVYVDHSVKTEMYGIRIGEGKAPAITIPVDADKIRPGDERGLINGLMGQKLITVGDHEEWKKVLHDHYGDTIKQAIVAGWIASYGAQNGTGDGRVG